MNKEETKMAKGVTKTPSKKVTQQPILNTDVESTAPETTIEEPIKEVSVAEQPKKPFVKSRRRTSLDEFAVVNQLRPEVKAGFKAWLKGQYFHFDEEWKTLFENYQNRKL